MKAQQILEIRARASEFQALRSLGQLKQKQGAGHSALGQPPGGTTRIAARLYDIEQLQFPLTASEFNTKLSANKRIFATDSEDECPGRQMNLAKGATVEAPFLAMAFGVLGTSGSYGFALPGIMVAKGAEGGADPTPCNSGCAAPGQHNAVYLHDLKTQLFLENFFQAYRVSMYFQRHFQIFEEAAHVMGLTGATLEFVGASGDVQTSVIEFIRETNDIMLAKGCDLQFLPQNAVDTDGGSECLPAPTASLLKGSVNIRGVSNRCYPMPVPLLWLPGMTLDARFVGVEGDCCYRAAMERDSVLDCAADPTKPSSTFANALACGVGDAGSYTVPGGCVSLGGVLAGYDVVPACCLEYLAGITQGTVLEQIYLTHGVGAYLAGKVLDGSMRSGLAGLPEGVVKASERFLGGVKL